MPNLIQEIKISLSKLGTAPRKRFGQNFMVNEETLRAIAASLAIQKGERVLEIGPGLGFLTREILEKGANVIAIEKDKKFVELLTKKFKSNTFKVIEADILKFNLSHLDPGSSKPLKLVGNIPYNITSPILEWLILNRDQIDQAVLTVQWEVAERLAAKPGSKNWGALSIFVQLYSDVALIQKVASHLFYPAPKVDSAVIRFKFLSQPRVAVPNEKFFFEIVRRAFQKRRKTLLNALQTEQLTKEKISLAFKDLHLDSQRRPETLSLEEWSELVSRLAKVI